MVSEVKPFCLCWSRNFSEDVVKPVSSIINKVVGFVLSPIAASMTASSRRAIRSFLAYVGLGST